VPLGVGKQQPAGLGNADAVPDGGQHVLQRLASRDVVVHVAGSDQGHPGSVGQVPEHFQPPLVIRPALEFGDQVTAIREDLAVAPEGCLRYVVRPLRDSFPVADQHARQQPFSVFGDILPSEFTLAFRRLATASRDQPAQAAVSSPVRGPQHDGWSVHRRDLRADNQLQSAVLGRRMRADHSRQTVLVRHRQCLVSQLRRTLYQLVRMRGALQEREIRFAVQLGVHLAAYSNTPCKNQR